MSSRILCGAKKLISFLSSVHDNTPCQFEEDMRISKVNGKENDLLSLLSNNQTIFICEKLAPKTDCEYEVQPAAENSNCSENGHDSSTEKEHDDPSFLNIEPGPLPLTVNQARQLVSFYTLAQNPCMALGDERTLSPLWVRCDMMDPAKTTWLGAEIVHTGTKTSGIKLFSVTCKGSTVDKKSFMTLDEVKQEHRKRHHSASVTLKGIARYNLFGSIVVENTIIESQSSVTVDLKWNDVGSILETPPMSSTATLNIKVSSGDIRSPMFELYRAMEFLQSLADGLRTGEIEWLETVVMTSAVNVTKAYLEELQNAENSTEYRSLKPAQTNETNGLKSEGETPTFTSLLKRGDLDFTEQLWVRLRKSVTSYQDIEDCLKLVIDALRYGNIKPWIHRDSNSSLSKLILKSYHQKLDSVPLSGLTPVQMLLEMGLDKMRRDYINYLIGEELTTINHLLYYLSTEVDLQEQFIRLKKLHHLLEIIVTCTTFLVPYHSLFQLTQSCLQHYKTNPYDENYTFELPVQAALISHFIQKEHPVMWGVEVSSGHGPQEVRTLLQLSDKPLVDHAIFETDFSDPNETMNGDSMDPAYFSTLVCCSLVRFA